jgi:hypothetical protein
MQVDLAAITALHYDGDLEIFLDKLDYILLEANTAIPEEFLYAIVEPELRNCNDLAPDFVALDATEDGDPKRTTSHLYNIARRCVTRKLRMSMREALVKDEPKKCLVVKPRDGDGDSRGAKPCFNFMKGTCKHGESCMYSHSISSSKASPAQKLKESKAIHCSHWQLYGACKFGDICIFKHADEELPQDDTEAQSEDKPSPRHKVEPGSATDQNGNPLECHQWANTGKCAYGDACKFVHD